MGEESCHLGILAGCHRGSATCVACCPCLDGKGTHELDLYTPMATLHSAQLLATARCPYNCRGANGVEAPQHPLLLHYCSTCTCEKLNSSATKRHSFTCNSPSPHIHHVCAQVKFLVSHAYLVIPCFLLCNMPLAVPPTRRSFEPPARELSQPLKKSCSAWPSISYPGYTSPHVLVFPLSSFLLLLSARSVWQLHPHPAAGRHPPQHATA